MRIQSGCGQKALISKQLLASGSDGDNIKVYQHLLLQLDMPSLLLFMDPSDSNDLYLVLMSFGDRYVDSFVAVDW